MIPRPENPTFLPPESPSILGRIGQRTANLPSEISNSLFGLLYNLGIKDPNQEQALEVPKPYDVPEAKTLGEGAVDIGSHIVESLPFFLTGGGAARGVAKLAGASPLITRMSQVAGEFGTAGLVQSPEFAATETVLGAGYGAAEKMLPGPLKYLTAAGVGAATALNAKTHGASDTGATAAGLMNSILPLLMGRKKVKPKIDSDPEIIAREGTEQLGPRLGYRESIGLRDDQFKLKAPNQAPEGSLIREPVYSEGEALAIARSQQRPLHQLLKLSDEPEFQFNGKGEVQPAVSTRTEPTSTQPFLRLGAPEGSLVRETSVTPLEARRAIGVQPPPGSLIRDPAFTPGEISRVLATREIANGKVVPIKSEIATLQPPTKSTNRLLLRTVLTEADTPMVEQAAKKLGLEFKGVQKNEGRYPDQLYFNITTPGRETTMSLPVGSTFKDLKNKVIEKNKTYDKAEKAATERVKIGAEPGSAASQAKVATLQQAETKASLPSSSETPTLPQGLKVGEMASFMYEGERTVGEIIGKGDLEGTVKIRTRAGELDRPASHLSMPGVRAVSESPVKSVGGMDDLEQLGTASQKGFLKVGGGKMRLSNFGEHGSISPEAAMTLARYGVAPVVGAAVGYAEDEKHRPESAIIGAVIGGLAGHMGGKIFKLLAAGHPKPIAPGVTKSNVFKDVIDSVGPDLKNFAKALTGNEEMARKAASHWGWSTHYDRLARWINKEARIDINVTRMRDRAYGITENLSNAIGESVYRLSKVEGIDAHFPSINNFFEGRISFATLQSKVPKDVAALAATAVQSRTALQNMIFESLGTGKLATTISNSIGKYMTTTYKIFHDKKYMPSDAEINSAARSIEKLFPGETLEKRIAGIHEYIHEVKANRALFGYSAKGESLGAILTRLEGDLTPEFKQMLGIYSNPLERMGFTAIKLVNGGRSAEFFNEVARGRKANGLKFAYESAEHDAAIATLQHASLYGYDPVARETARLAMEELKTYVKNPAGVGNGRLAGKWMDVKMRDQLANYDTAVRNFTTPFLRGISEATNLIKYNKIILSPLQFVRQVIQLPVLGAIAHTNPADWGRGFMALRNPAEFSRLQRIGILSGDPVGGMLRRDMRAMLDGTLDALLHEQVKRGLHKWEEIWRTPDLVIRASAFLKKEAQFLEQGMSKQEAIDAAVDFTNRYTMNYGAVPPIIAKGRQLPFINQYLSWSYETLRITKNLLEDAKGGDPYAIGILSTMATAPFIIQSMSESMLSDKDRDEWNKVKNLGPEYNRYNFRMGIERLPNGDFRYIDFTPLVMHEPFMRMMRAAMAGDVEAVKSNNPVVGWENTPLLNISAVLTTGRDRFSGSKLHSTADKANAIWKEVAPTLLSTELARFKRAITPNEEGSLGTMDLRTGQTNSISDIVQTYLTAMRPYTLRPEHVKRQAAAETRDQIRSQQLVLRRVLSSNASADVKENAKKSFNQARDEILRSLNNRLGLDEIQPESVQP